MSTIVIKYIADHKFNKEMNDKEFSQHILILLELLTDKLKKDKSH